MTTQAPTQTPPTLQPHEQFDCLEAARQHLVWALEHLVVVQSQAHREGDLLLAESLKPSVFHLLSTLESYPSLGDVFVPRLGLKEQHH